MMIDDQKTTFISITYSENCIHFRFQTLISVVFTGTDYKVYVLMVIWGFEHFDEQATISCFDMSLDTASKHPIYMPHTAGRYQARRFRKAQCPIVERLTNSLMMHGRNNGNEIVKIACLTALSSWVARSPNAIDSEEFIAFLICGLKEKQSIRRGHLRCLLSICSNADAVLRMSCLRKPLIQLVKASSTKAEQQLDGIYALMILVKIAATDEKTAESMNDGKIATMVMKNEHSLAMVSNLSIEDGKSYLDLLTSLLVDHPARVTKAFDCKLLMQVVLAFLWHPRYAIRKVAYGCAKKILETHHKLVLIMLNELSMHLKGVILEPRYNFYEILTPMLFNLLVFFLSKTETEPISRLAKWAVWVTVELLFCTISRLAKWIVLGLDDFVLPPPIETKYFRTANTII
ncbi:ILITYHIA [Artemisia annua]|uniref:ILITYHIA n=1 Tax=Artemisia annua TaxID=35608 RepID=A0A2U1Q3J5_ARTAN|nr:ILITYHIA [Artemisia annua]